MSDSNITKTNSIEIPTDGNSVNTQSEIAFKVSNQTQDDSHGSKAISKENTVVDRNHSLLDNDDGEVAEEEEEEQKEKEQIPPNGNIEQIDIHDSSLLHITRKIDTSSTSGTSNNLHDTINVLKDKLPIHLRSNSTDSVAVLFHNSVTNSLQKNRPSTHMTNILPRTPQTQPRWDSFVRRGTRLKTLLGDAMQEVQNSIHRTRSRSSDDGNDDHNNGTKRARVVQVADFSAELAREKTNQVMQLQRQLKDAQAQASALQAANASLREEHISSSSRLERTTEALRIAATNADKARADADAAEATASTLAQTLQSLQIVIDETKRASQILHDEQIQVSAIAASIEAKLLQKEGALARAQKEVQSLRQTNATLEKSQEQWKDERTNLENFIQEHIRQVETLQRQKQEQTAVEQARKDRADKIESEWRRAQELLVEATAGQEAAAQTQAVLEETIESLQKANQDLHQSLKDHQDTERANHGRLSEALTKAEIEAQQLRIAAESAEEEMSRLKMDKAASDKQIQQLKVRLNKVEHDLKEQQEQSMVATIGTKITTNEANGAVSPEVNGTPTSTSLSLLSFRLPPLNNTSTKTSTSINTPSRPVTEKENEGVLVGTHCCICFKPTMGIMKTCQCGHTQCQKRAHIYCVKHIQPGPSVSHPGTPSVPLPLVLCNRGAARRQSNVENIKQTDCKINNSIKTTMQH